MSEISELILLLNNQHQEQMTMLQEQLKILQSSLNNPRENLPTPVASLLIIWQGSDYSSLLTLFPKTSKRKFFLPTNLKSVYKMLSNLAAQQQPVKSIHEQKRKPGETIPELASRIRQDAATCDFQSIKDPLVEDTLQAQGPRSGRSGQVASRKVQNLQNARKENRLLQVWKFWTF